MQFLIFKGAIIDSWSHKKSIAEEKGAAKIVTWLGMTSEELSDQYQQSQDPSSSKTDGI
jgi:hypothetical protein